MWSRRALLTFVPFVIAACVLALACSSDPPAEAPLVCADAGVDPATCTAPFPATYDAIYQNTFQPSCARSGVSCHAATGQQGGINFEDENAAYAALQGKLKAGNPNCSNLVQRVLSTNGKVRMPPGRSLDAGEQCAIVQWVAAGAKR